MCFAECLYNKRFVFSWDTLRGWGGVQGGRSRFYTLALEVPNATFTCVAKQQLSIEKHIPYPDSGWIENEGYRRE